MPKLDEKLKEDLESDAKEYFYEEKTHTLHADKSQPQAPSLSTLKKIGLNAVGILAGVTVVPGFLAANALYNLALNRSKGRMDFMQRPEINNNPEATKTYEQYREEREKIQYLHWISENVEKQPVEMLSQDGLKLFAYVIVNPAAERRWMVLIHGYASTHDMFGPQAKAFFDAGFSLLLPDLRGHGNSGGNAIGMGWPDRRDIVQWIDKLVADYGAESIALYGISMGSATVMMTSGEPLPPQVKAAVADCGYTSVEAEFRYLLRVLFGLMPFPLLYYTSLICRLRAGYFFSQASSVKQLRKAKIPMLFIHGDRDRFVPYFMLQQVCDAAACPKEMLTVAGAGHGDSCYVDPEKYFQTVSAFLQKNC